MNSEDTSKLHNLLDRLASEAEVSSRTDAASDDTNAAVYAAFAAVYRALVATTHELVSLEGEDFAARVAAFVNGSSSHSAEVRFQMKPPRMTVEFVAQFVDGPRRMTVAEQTVLAFCADSEDAPPSTSH